MRITSAALAINLVLAGPIITGCSSHLISSGLPDGTCAAGNCAEGQVSIAGRAGLNTRAATGEIAQQCADRPLTRVEVRRNFGQGAATVLTLGLVNPVTIHFACAKDQQVSPLYCEELEGTASPGVPTQISCTMRATDEREAIDYDCIATSTPEVPERIAAFSCEAVSASEARAPAFLLLRQIAKG